MNLHISSWITGFVDGEGCFSVSFSKREKVKTGIEVRPSFSVSQLAPSRKSLELINNAFGVGGIRYSKKDNCYKYEVRSSKDLRNVVIPHFHKYPLQTTKKNDFLKLEKVLDLVKRNHHLNIDGMKSIIDIVFNDGNGLPTNRSYTKEQLLKLLKS
uniref:Putative LAGLIDADG homing endonuclease n=1 Tax=Symbiochloris reticulata TaxID=40981 RepID=A0A1B0RYA9_9CHLO|nr:putative LAGLIDADG homing endonuclease [Symbiochloris reticulata]